MNEQENKEAEKPKPRSYGSGHGTMYGYIIEVRTSYKSQAYGDFVVTREWQQLPTIESPLGVGIAVRHYSQVIKPEEIGLLTYTAAVGIAARFKAKVWPHGSSLELRIVQVRLKFDYSTEETGVGEILPLSDITAKFTPREPEKNESV